MRSNQQNKGVAWYYIEHDCLHSLSFQKIYMHLEVSDRPFDVGFVDAENLLSSQPLLYAQTIDDTMS